MKMFAVLTIAFVLMTAGLIFGAAMIHIEPMSKEHSIETARRVESWSLFVAIMCFVALTWIEW
jgi:hypothetical protein